MTDIAPCPFCKEEVYTDITISQLSGKGKIEFIGNFGDGCFDYFDVNFICYSKDCFLYDGLKRTVWAKDPESALEKALESWNHYLK